MIEQPSGLVLVMEGGSGKPIGMLVALAHPGITSPALQATELAWWVEPDHRGSREAMTLLSEYEAWARAQGCVSITLSNIHHQKGDAVQRIYEHMGYRMLESSFAKSA